MARAEGYLETAGGDLARLVGELDEPAAIELIGAAKASHSLAQLIVRYLATEVHGVQSDHTLRAKTQDLTAFARWFLHVNGHAEVADWVSRDTQAYLTSLESVGRTPSTINRAFASIRHFARWAQSQPGSIFARHGLPTRGVKELRLEESSCKKFSRIEMHRLLRAADSLVALPQRVTQRPRRARALLMVLYYTGLRISEVLVADLKQYSGRYLIGVKRKGRGWTNKVYLALAARDALDDYIKSERPQDAEKLENTTLFLAERTGLPWTSNRAREALRRIGQEAGKHHGQAIDVHPHRLRHTFAAEYRDKTGSDTETARALGHTSLQYVGRYARRSDGEREMTIDALFQAESR